MPYEEIRIEHPVRCPQAFLENDEASKLSQAALLLSLTQLLTATPGTLVDRQQAEFFPLPRLMPLRGRLDRREIAQHARESLGKIPEDVDRDASSLAKTLFVVAQRLYETGNPLDAGMLASIAMLHPDPLVANAAAIAEVDLLDDPAPGLNRLFAAADAEQPDIAKRIAAVALNRLLGQETFLTRPASGESRLPPMPLAANEAPDSLVLVHGTTNFAWPGGGIPPSWWRPGEPLYEYLRQNSRPDIYAGPDPFEWGGAWNDQGRDFGARHLRDWLARENIRNPDFVAHSHGGNLIMHATRHYGLRANRLVLLSCPVHWQTYRPEPGSIRFAQSIRINMDLIILADLGAQRFPDGTIPEAILPLWFVDHGDPYRPDYWAGFRLDSYLL